MKKARKPLSLILAMVMILSIIVIAPTTASAAVSSRNDGNWFFPLPQNYYKSFTDWAGCNASPGATGACPFHGSSCLIGCGAYHKLSNGMGHNGIDIGCPANTNVYASSNGNIVYAGALSARGNTIIMEHKIANTNYSYYSIYQHLASFVKSSGSANAGDLIAKSGNSGGNYGYHLHFSIIRGESGLGTNCFKYDSYGSSARWLTGNGEVGQIVTNPKPGNTNLSSVNQHAGSVTYVFSANQATFWGKPAGNNPQGCLDSVSSPSPGKITVRGWAFDRDNLGASLAIHVYVGGPAGSGAPGYAITANKSRPDVNNAYPGVGNNHGFDDTISVSRTGSQVVYVYAINVGSGNTNPCLGSRTVTISSDSTAPTITNIYADSFTTTGYSLHCDLADDTELSRVVLYISTANVSQKSFTVATSGKQKTVTYDVKYSDFNNDTTDYTVGVWAYDTTGNVAKAPWTKVSPQNKSLKPTTEGEFNGHRYKYFKNQMSSEVAQKVCQKMGGHLVTVNSKAENDYLVNLTKGYTGTAWIGSYYANEKWYWVKDEPFSYSNWKTGEPNNTNGNEYRVNMYVGGEYAGQWNDINAFSTNVEGFICEFENDIDTSKYYSSGIVRYNNHEYWLFNYGVDWDTANAVCESKGGHLLTIESEEENVTVTSLLNELMTKQEIWLGISDVEKEGVWKDINGYSLTYTNWNTNEPNNTDKVEDFGMLLNTGKWNDTKSFAGIYRSTGFICEFDKIITSIDTEPSDTVSTNPTQPTTKPTETTEPTQPSTTKPTEPIETQPTTVKTTEPTIFTNESATQSTPTKPVVKKVVKVSLRKKSVVLVKGRSTTVKATVTPTNATNKKLKWTTSNAKVATVNQSGKIIAKGRGNATIKVMALDGSNKYATVKVTVKQPVTSIKLNKKSANLKVKGNAKQKTVTLKATVNPKNANNKAVTWKSSNTKIATVNSKGKVIAKKKGTCYIIVTAKDGSKKYAKCKVVVK